MHWGVYSALGDIISALGDIMICVGDIVSAMGGAQCIGGYHQSLEDMSVLVEHPQCTDDIPHKS